MYVCWKITLKVNPSMSKMNVCWKTGIDPLFVASSINTSEVSRILNKNKMIHMVAVWNHTFLLIFLGAKQPLISMCPSVRIFFCSSVCQLSDYRSLKRLFAENAVKMYWNPPCAKITCFLFEKRSASNPDSIPLWLNHWGAKLLLVAIYCRV